MSRTFLKRAASVIVILVTIALGANYWHNHPEITVQLQQVGVSAILGLIGLYLCMNLVLTAVYDSILRITGKSIPTTDNALLTMYSSIVNFFGPLQSGPGFRMLYLKKKYDVSIKAYASATILYYGLFGLCSLLFVAFGIIPPALMPLVIAIIVLVGWLVWRSANKIPLLKRYVQNVSGAQITRLAAFTGLQAILTIAIYYVELHSIGIQASLVQTVIYTGAANLALFVSLTPGALGFRESFLYITQRLHEIPNSAIVTANILDRGIYLVFLGCLLMIILAMHANKRFGSVAAEAKEKPPKD